MTSKLRHLLAPLCALTLAACGGDAAPTNEAESSQSAAPSKKAKPITGLTSKINTIKETDMVLGDPNAPVTMVEYASLTCGGCADFHKKIIPAIKKDYVDTGKLKLVLREFPIYGGATELSKRGSAFARCAAEKNDNPEAFFSVVGWLFNTFGEWRTGQSPALPFFLKAASQVNINEEEFNACIEREDLIAIIDANVEEASNEFKVPGTPSVYINGALVETNGYISDYETKLPEAIDKALAAHEEGAQ